MRRIVLFGLLFASVLAHAVNYTLTVTVSGANGTVSSSPSGISACTSSGGTCSASFTSGTVVTLTASPGVISGTNIWAIFTGWSGACSSASIGGYGNCLVTMSAAESVTATFLQAPQLPQNYVNNLEYASAVSSPTHTITVSSGSGWNCHGTTYGPYAQTASGFAQVPLDAETCRTAYLSDSFLLVYPANATDICSSCIVLPQTTGDTSTSFIVLTSSSPVTTGTTACSHGMGDNIAEMPYGTIGLRNVFCDGTRMSYQLGNTVTALYTLTTTTNTITAGSNVYVGVVSTSGFSASNSDPRAGLDWGINHEAETIEAVPSSGTCAAHSVTYPCIELTSVANSHASGIDITAPQGSVSLANGQTVNTSNYNDVASMFNVQYTGSKQGITTSSGADGSPAHHYAVLNFHIYPTPCTYNPSPTAPTCTGGNKTTLSMIAITNSQGIQSTSAINQIPDHLHFAYDYLSADFTDTTPAGYPVGQNSIVEGYDFPTCTVCSIMYGYTDRLLYPGTEGHQVQLGYAFTIKIAHNWFEGQSSGTFSNGYAFNMLLLPTYIMATDVEDRSNRYTYPISWIQAWANTKRVNNGSASYVRKNASELKSGFNYLRDGNIYENVDNSGGQTGVAFTAKVSANTSTNYMLENYNLTMTHLVFRGMCIGPNWGDSGSTVVGFGGGNSLGVANVLFGYNLGYNLGASIQNCAANEHGWGAAPSVNEWSCTASSGASTNPDGTTPITLTCASMAGSTALAEQNGWPVVTQSCSDATFNTPATSIGPPAYNTSPSSLVLSYNLAGATLNESGVTCNYFGNVGSPFNSSTLHSTFIVQQGNPTTSVPYAAAYYSSYSSGGTPAKPTYFMKWNSISNNLFAEVSQESAQGTQGFAGQPNEGTKMMDTIWDDSTLLFNTNAIAGRALHGFVNCVPSGSNDICTLVSGDAPNGQGSAMVGKNVTINGTSYGPVGSGVSSTQFKLPSSSSPGNVANATYLWAQYTEWGGTYNTITPPVTDTFPAATQCSGADPTLVADAVPNCIGMAGAMSTTSYPLALSDWTQYRLCRSGDSSCSGKASLYGAGQTYQASDSADLGAPISAIITAQVENSYGSGYADSTLTAAIGVSFLPGNGSYPTSQTITVTSPTPSAQLCWNTTGSPATNGLGTGCTTGTSIANGGTITVSTSETVYVAAGTSSLSDTVSSAVYAITGLSGPVFSPVAGTYTGAQSVSITSAAPTICYNFTGSPATNGSTGCTIGFLYTSPVLVNSTETLYAAAGGPSYTDDVGSAAYTINYSLNVAITGTGTVTSSPSGISCPASTCSATFASGTTVTLTESSGNPFAGWSGACSGTTSTCSVLMNQNQAVTAGFAPPAPAAPKGGVYLQ